MRTSGISLGGLAPKDALPAKRAALPPAPAQPTCVSRQIGFHRQQPPTPLFLETFRGWLHLMVLATSSSDVMGLTHAILGAGPHASRPPPLKRLPEVQLDTLKGSRAMGSGASRRGRAEGEDVVCMGYVSGRTPGNEPELPGPTSKGALPSYNTLPPGDIMHGETTFDGLQLIPGGVGRQLEREIIPQVNQDLGVFGCHVEYDTARWGICVVVLCSWVENHLLTPHCRLHPAPPSLLRQGVLMEEGLPTTAGGVAAGPNATRASSTPRHVAAPAC